MSKDLARRIAAIVAAFVVFIGLTSLSTSTASSQTASASSSAKVNPYRTYEACDKFNSIRGMLWVCIKMRAKFQDDGTGMAFSSVSVEAYETEYNDGSGDRTGCSYGPVWEQGSPGPVDTYRLGIDRVTYGPFWPIYDPKWAISGTPNINADNGCEIGYTFSDLRKTNSQATRVSYDFKARVNNYPDHTGSVGIWFDTLGTNEWKCQYPSLDPDNTTDVCSVS